jgi:PAS domain S-box-containing protein
MADLALTSLALDHLAEGVLVVDSLGRVIYANHRAAALFGRPREALVEAPFSAPIQTDEPVEIVIPKSDGDERIVEMRVVPLAAEGGPLSLISLSDVTDRRRYEAQLRGSEAMYRSVIESAHDGFWITDMEGRILEVNNAYLAMTGHRREDLLGARPDDLDVGADSDSTNVRARIDRVVTEGTDLFETRHRTRLGSVIDVEVSLSYAPINDGRFFVFIRDISLRKRAEAAILAAKQAAEHANKAKSEFLAAMSHDLRTPLNAIMGFAEIMRDELYGPLGSDRYRDYVRAIEDSGALLVSLVNDVLDLSKIETGKYDLCDGSLDLREAMERAVTQTAVLGKDMRVEVDCAPGLWILADERALAQVFNNILSNAIKFNRRDRPIRFEAALHDPDSAGDGLDIRVIDYGIGMTREALEKAIRPFDAANSMQPRRFKGTGLGLYLSIQVMELMGGALRVDSEPGQGTVVTLWLPSNRVITGEVARGI